MDDQKHRDHVFVLSERKSKVDVPVGTVMEREGLGGLVGSD